MSTRRQTCRRLRGSAAGLCAIVGALGVALPACSPVEIAGATVGVTTYGAASPAHEIEQIYYLGTFDPQEQLPPTIYRVRVRGQASVISSTAFASGWVPAEFIDSLNTHIGFDVNDPRQPGVQISQGEKELRARLETGRRLVQFGPEGFREVPKDHRLVIVMGASPEAFFQAIDQALGSFGELRREQSATALKSELFEALNELRAHEHELDKLSSEIEIEVVRSEQLSTLNQPAPEDPPPAPAAPQTPQQPQQPAAAPPPGTTTSTATAPPGGSVVTTTTTTNPLPPAPAGDSEDEPGG